MQLSVIIPVYNDWHRVPPLLAALTAQTLEPDAFEILLIDNGSERFAPPDTLPDNARLLECAEPGAYAARNHGIAHASGQWLAFTDADCRPRPEWLQALLHHAEAQDGRTLVAGRVRMTASGDRPGPWEMHDLVKGIPQDWYVRRGYAATANLLVPAVLARELGGFDAARYSGGDADFCRRAVAAGAGLVYADDAVVEHPARTTWAQLAAKYRRIKGGQLLAGSRSRRLVWAIRSFLPPVIAVARFLADSRWPFRYRLWAVAVQQRLWWLDVVETVRLVRARSAVR